MSDGRIGCDSENGPCLVLLWLASVCTGVRGRQRFCPSSTLCTKQGIWSREKLCAGRCMRLQKGSLPARHLVLLWSLLLTLRCSSPRIRGQDASCNCSILGRGHLPSAPPLTRSERFGTRRGAVGVKVS